MTTNVNAEKPWFFVDNLYKWAASKKLPPYLYGKQWCHFWSNGNNEMLDEIVASIGGKKSWGHSSYSAIMQRDWYHYNLTSSMREKVLKLDNVIEIPLRNYLKLFDKPDLLSIYISTYFGRET